MYVVRANIGAPLPTNTKQWVSDCRTSEHTIEITLSLRSMCVCVRMKKKQQQHYHYHLRQQKQQEQTAVAATTITNESKEGEKNCSGKKSDALTQLA